MDKSKVNQFFDSIGLYFRTLRYLTFKQIYYQINHRIKKVIFKQMIRVYPVEVVGSLNLQISIPSKTSYLSNHTFEFLNQKKNFAAKIEWDFIGFDKLWAYHLNYFDYLNQKEIHIKEAIELIKDFCQEPSNRKEGTEPYPISLRGINWIKFFVYHRVSDPRFNATLYAHYQILVRNIECHLGGNHLLENGFSLLFGAYYFKSDRFYRKSVSILRNELREQILKDGAHFELSPMYHQIILFRLLDCINLMQNNSWNSEEGLLQFLTTKAKLMMSWIQAMTFSSGDIPLVNDAALGIAPGTSELIEYSKTLGLLPETRPLSESGYRMIRKKKIELLIDIGNIGPDYIPGHAHSDTFNFILYIKNKPIIVDTGISTYSRNTKRLSERSTDSHNTVKINGYNQSEVWASFRVGRRAKIINLYEDSFEISATHNGYGFIGIHHQRTWKWDQETIEIKDLILGKSDKCSCAAYFHFHPDVDVFLESDGIFTNYLSLKFIHAMEWSLEEYDFSMGFNLTRRATKVKVLFTNELLTMITPKDLA